MEKIDKLPFDDLIHIGDLVNITFPTTSVFKSKAGLPLVLEWADVANDEFGDTFYFYQTTPHQLRLFIEKKISHLNFIENAKHGITYIFKGFINEPQDLKYTSIKNLPTSYYPNFDVYFDEEDSDDIESIYSAFDLINIDNYEVDHYIGNYYNLHVNQGKHISFGEGNAKVVGEVLSNFTLLYQEVVEDKYKGVNRRAKLNPSQQKTFNEDRNLNISGLMAASLSILLKSKFHIENYIITKEDDLIVSTNSDDIFERISYLISNATTLDEIDKIKNSYNSKVFKKLELLAKAIKDNELSIDFNYKTISRNKFYSTNISAKNAPSIIVNINSIYEDKINTETHVGTFDMINCGTKYFNFRSTSESLHGYFRDNVVDLKGLDFRTNYQVVISREEKRGKKDKIKILELETMDSDSE